MIYTYKGYLATYFETGFEAVAVILQDERGIDQNGFCSLDWAYFFSKTPCELKVFFTDGSVIYDGPITMDKEKSLDTKSNFGFYPNEIEHIDWELWVSKEYKAELKTVRPVYFDEKNK